MTTSHMDLERRMQPLAGMDKRMQLPADRPRRGICSSDGNCVQFQLTPVVTQQLREVSDDVDCTLFATVTVGWALLLARWRGQDEVTIWVTLAEHTAASEVSSHRRSNIVPLRVRVDEDVLVEQLVRRVQAGIDEAARHAGPSAAQLQDEFDSLRADALVRVCVKWHTENDASTVSACDVDQEGWELSLQLRVGCGALSGQLLYIPDRFDQATVERLLDCWQVLLEGMARKLLQPASQLPMLSDKQRTEVLREFNSVQAQSPCDCVIQELFEEEVLRTPDKPAVLFGGQTLDFAELNQRANQLAWYLRERGVRPDQLVAICVERSVDMVVGILGILKSGAAYVPMDPSYPQDRLEYMLRDSAPSFMVTQRRIHDQLPRFDGETVELDAQWNAIGQCPETNPQARGLGLRGSNLAYVIYTSGSTGRPKAAMNEHRGMVNRILAQDEIEVFYAGDICCQKTSISFVDAVCEILGPLCRGYPLAIVPETAAKDGGQLAAFIAHKGVTRLITVPSLARSMLVQEETLRDLRRLRSWTLSGEEVQADLLIKLQRHLPECEFIVQYGSSEVSSDAAIYKSRSFVGGHVPIGKPLPNTIAYILDPYGEPVPVGVAGEIYVGGVGVSRGYLHRPALTAERFLPNPFNDSPGARMYRTGDLGRWRADGVMEYLGRADHQVKIRGFRIELAEIEARLLNDRRVRDAVVIAREDVPGEKQLVAYVTQCVAREEPPASASSQPSLQGDFEEPAESSLSVSSLRAHVADALPAYMVPAAFVVLEALPSTPNGKVNRRALPPPPITAFATKPYESPSGRREQRLAQIWQDLLHVPRVGRQDNFFELGGHSLLIARMIEALRREGWQAELRDIYSSATLANLARELSDVADAAKVTTPGVIPAGADVITPAMLPLADLDSEQIARIVQSVPGGAANVQDIYPLAPLQEGMLFHHVLEEHGANTYVLPTLLRLASRKRLEDLIAALQAEIDRHDVLRTAVFWEDLRQPVQVVYRRATLPVRQVALENESREEQVAEWLSPHHLNMDLSCAPLVNLTVAPDPRDEGWYALLQIHHIVSDDVSMKILIKEVVARLQGLPVDIPPARYREHVAVSLMDAKHLDATAFFRKKLADVEEPTAPFGLLDTHKSPVRMAQARHDVDPRMALRLRSSAARLGMSAAAMFYAAWALVVAHTSARDDVVFGSVLLGRLRSSEGSGQAVGMFINTLPLRLTLKELSVRELALQTRRELAELLDYEQASLATAQRCSSVDPAAPLFTAVLNFRHEAIDPALDWACAEGVRMLAVEERTNYPIVVSIDDLGDRFGLVAQVDERVDPNRLLSYLGTALVSMCDALENAPRTAALALPIVPVPERQELLHVFNATAAEHPVRWVHELFEDQVRQTPNALAVAFGDERVTYAELNAAANQLANFLREKGISVDQLVGVCVDRSVDMVVSLLAILKTGAAYIPIDPSYPAERVRYMLTDAAPPIVLTQSHIRQQLPLVSCDMVELDTVRQDIAACDTSDIELAPDSTSRCEVDLLVYVIYTSGSTGRPKGTAMGHRALANLLAWHHRTLPVKPELRVLQFAALSFDVAFQEVFSTLCDGGTLVLLEDSVRKDPQALLHFLREERIERLFLPPMMLYAVAQSFAAGAVTRPQNLRDVIVAGEQLRIDEYVSSFFSAIPDCRLHNHYGPTETHVVTAFTLVADPRSWPSVPSIGRPISNLQVHVMDSHLRMAAIGVAGEIYLGGAGLAREYLGRPQLTAERFVADPFSEADNSRLYKTGDLGRWLADGTLEYLGRNDDQVKIRGFRVEIGEVEAQLVRHEQVREAAVTVRQDGPNGIQRLVAYVTLRHGSSVSVENLRSHLQESLPDHALPSAFVTLDSLPTTPSGKLDRRGLPAPQLEAYATQQFEAPRGEVEQEVARIWADVLRLDQVGRNDNFFTVGGHSLLAMQVVVRVRAGFGVHVPIRDLFACPTLVEFAAKLTALRQSKMREAVEHGGEEVQQLLESLAAMSEDEVEQLLKAHDAGERL